MRAGTFDGFDPLTYDGKWNAALPGGYIQPRRDRDSSREGETRIMLTSAAGTSIRREELYDRVWHTPMRHLAKEYGFSDVGLAKLCRRHNIPTPPVGYWAKLEHGKAPVRPKLPPADGESLIDLTRERPEAETEIALASTFFDPEIGRLAEAEMHLPIVVADAFRAPHEAVLHTKNALQVAADSKFQREGDRLYPHREDRLPLLDVAVGKALRGRALRILDALLKACETRGYSIGPAENRWEHGVRIFAFGQSFQLKLRELSKRTRRELSANESERLRRNPDTYISNRYEYKLTGTLQLELCHFTLPNVTLRDGKTRKVEDGLSRVMLAILREVDASRRRDAENARREAERREQERIQREQEEERRRKELKRERRQARINALIGTANAWRQNQILRDYIVATRGLIIERDGHIEPGGKIEAWFRWAEHVADSLDPLRDVRRAKRRTDARG